MVSLRSFTLILLTLCCREVAGADPSLPAGRALLAVLAMVLGFAVLTKMLAFEWFGLPGRMTAQSDPCTGGI